MRYLLAIALCFSLGCQRGEGSVEPKNQVQVRASRVEIAELVPSTPTLDLNLPGEVEGARDSLLASTLGGYVERVLVHKGQEIKSGTPLAYVNKSALDAALLQAEGQFQLAKAENERAAQAGSSLSKARKDTARFTFQSAQAAYEIARINARRGVIRAPFDGVVAQIHVEEGEVVGPGGQVARLVQMDPVLVTLTVSDRDVTNLTTGLEVTVTTHARSDLFPGVITRITPAADIRSRAFEVDVEVDNDERRLLPGMIARVNASVVQDTESLTLPQYVLVTRKDANGVFVVIEGKAHWREVKLGNLIRDQVVVLSGVEAGEHVVVTGHRELANEDAVIVSRRGVCCSDGRVLFEDDEEHASAP